MTESYKIPEGPDQLVTAGEQTPHPGAFIREEVLKPFGLSVAEAARRMGIQRVGLINVLDGKSGLSNDLAYKLEALTGVDADLMIGWQVRYDRAQGAAKRAAYAQTIERVKKPEAAATPAGA